MKRSLFLVLGVVAAFLVGIAGSTARGAGVVKWDRCAVDIGAGAGVSDVSAGGRETVTVYAIVDGAGMFRSADLGKTWVALSGDVAKDAGCVAAMPNDGNRVYAGRKTAGQGLWLSKDGGATWSQAATAASGLASDDVESIAFCASDTAVILVGHRGGTAISVSLDGGTTWHASTFGKDPIKNQVVFAVDAKRWLVASHGGDMEQQTRAIAYTADGGATWASPAGDADYFAGPLPVIQAGEAFFSTKHHGVNKSEDGGKTWAYHMEGHTRMVGSAGEILFREGDRQFNRGTRDRVLSLEISDNLAQSWTSANANLLQVVPKDQMGVLTISADRDPFAHVRIATAWASTPDGHDVFLSLGKAGLYHGKLLWGKNGPRLAGVEVKPMAVPEGDTHSRVIINAIASAKRGPVKRVYADLTSMGLGEIDLFDDGQHDDGAAHDKVYGNSFTVPQGTPTGPKMVGVVAEDDKGNGSSASVMFEVASRQEKMVVWNGEQFAGGFGWISPAKPLNTFKAQTEEVHSPKVAMEMHGEGSAFIGGGWNWFGFYPANAGTDLRKFANLTFWAKYETFEGDKSGNVEASLVSNNEGSTGSVDVSNYCHDLTDGQWHEIVIPLADLYAGKKTGTKEFDASHCWMLNFNSWAPYDRSFSLYVDDVGFDNRAIRPHSQWATAAEPRTPAALPADAPTVTADVDTAAQGTAISPFIYGCAMGDVKAAQEMGMTIQRAGGNPITALNWKTGFSNQGADWYFTNTGTQVPPEENWLVKFPGVAKQAGMGSYISMPMMGRVAKDGTSAAFDIRKYPDQTGWAGKAQPTDPHPNAGSGLQYVRGADGQITKGPDGQPLTKEIQPDPDDSSIAMSPEDQTEMFRFMIEKMKYGTANQGGVKYVALDNEPTLWSATHRGMYPKGVSNDELWDRTRTYGSLVKKIDPGIKLAGPTLWGWTAYFYSGKDQQEVSHSNGKLSWDNPPDFTAHGKVPLAKWYLQKNAEYRKETGKPLVDILDFHFYPQTGHYMGGVTNDPKWMESRVQETRVMWDPTWEDPTWMGKEANPPKVIKLLRLMKQWIAETGNEGMQTSLGEYSFGGENDVSGGVAQAELLGIFAREGLDYAFYWFAPPPNSSTYFGFKMLRNPDGNHTAFGDQYLPSKVSAPDDVSVHAARDSKTGRLTFVLVNKRASKPAKVVLNLDKPIREQDLVAYEYSGADAYIIGELPAKKVAGKKIEIDLAPMSVQRFDVLP